MLKVVLDSNIITGAFIRKENDCVKLMDKEYTGQFNTFASNDTMEEMLSIAKAYSLSNELNLNKVEVVEFFKKITRLYRRANPIETTNRVYIIKSDDTDNIFLECAMESNTDYIITKNYRHFKEAIGKIKNINDRQITICSPIEFMNIMEITSRTAETGL